LSYRISNSLDTVFCIEAFNEAIACYGKPEIFNSDQGCQFTSYFFTQKLLDCVIKISMDGKGRTIDNIMIERFFRTLKYEDIYLKRYTSIKELKCGVNKYMDFIITNKSILAFTRKHLFLLSMAKSFHLTRESIFSKTLCLTFSTL
jgi:putative transposase